MEKDHSYSEMIENLKEHTDNIDEYMNESYTDLLFLGSSLVHDEDVIKVVRFTIDLCNYYFNMKEDYLKLAKLKELSDLISKEKIKIVDDSVINSISIFQN